MTEADRRIQVHREQPTLGTDTKYNMKIHSYNHRTQGQQLQARYSQFAVRDLKARKKTLRLNQKKEKHNDFNQETK